MPTEKELQDELKSKETELKSLKSQVEKLTKERDDFKEKVENLELEVEQSSEVHEELQKKLETQLDEASEAPVVIISGSKGAKYRVSKKLSCTVRIDGVNHTVSAEELAKDKKLVTTLEKMNSGILQPSK